MKILGLPENTELTSLMGELQEDGEGKNWNIGYNHQSGCNLLL